MSPAVLLGVGYHAARFRIGVLRKAGFVRMRKQGDRALLEVVPAPDANWTDAPPA